MPETHDSSPDPLLDGRYRLGERLGRGGMADVYRAVDVLLGRDVAVKIIRAGTDGVSARERAQGEMSALASLNHPSLVTLLDARLDPGAEHQYLVMELVEGPTLSQHLMRGPLAPREAAQLASELAEALHVVHAADVVHRDIKPSNVLLSPAQLPGRAFRAKLADFGIAYLVDRTRVTSPGDIIGTVAYLAPEQVNGSTPASPADIYALGLVLVEALSGSPAFPHAVGVASALARVNAPPELPPSLSPQWRDLLERMTRVDPADRPTALEVAVAAAHLAGWSPEETPASPSGAALAGAGAVGVAAAGAVAAAHAADDAAVAEPVTALLPSADSPVTEVLAHGGPATASTGDGPATQVLPAGALADAEATASSPAASPPKEQGSRRRRGMLVGAAAVGVAAAIGAGVWGIGALSGTPDPARDEPALTDPTPRPSAPASEEPGDEAPEEELVSDDEGGEPDTPEQTQPTPTEEAPAEEDPAEEAPAPEPTATVPAPEEPAPSAPADPEPTIAPEEPAPSEPAPDPSAPVPDPVSP